MLVVYFALGTSLAVLAQVPTLLQPTTLTGTVPDNDATVKRARNVLVNTPLLQSPTATSFAVPLFDGAQVMLVRDSTSIVAKGGLIWRGHAMNDPTTTATVSMLNGVVIGNLRTQGGAAYHIRYLGLAGSQRIHSLCDIDLTRLPEDEFEPTSTPPIRRNGAGDTCSTDPPTNIDALVVYTAKTRSAAGGRDAIEATINLAVYYAKQAYKNSPISQQLRLVHMEEVILYRDWRFSDGSGPALKPCVWLSGQCSNYVTGHIRGGCGGHDCRAFRYEWAHLWHSLGNVQSI